MLGFTLLPVEAPDSLDAIFDKRCQALTFLSCIEKWLRSSCVMMQLSRRCHHVDVVTWTWLF